MWAIVASKARVCYTVAASAGVCGCGALTHFFMHPCMEHAIAALLAFMIGFMAFFGFGRSKVSVKSADTCCKH